MKSYHHEAGLSGAETPQRLARIRRKPAGRGIGDCAMAVILGIAAALLALAALLTQRAVDAEALRSARSIEALRWVGGLQIQLLNLRRLEAEVLQSPTDTELLQRWHDSTELADRALRSLSASGDLLESDMVERAQRDFREYIRHLGGAVHMARAYETLRVSHPAADPALQTAKTRFVSVARASAMLAASLNQQALDDSLPLTGIGALVWPSMMAAAAFLMAIALILAWRGLQRSSPLDPHRESTPEGLVHAMAERSATT
jgi:hypothetical protein